DVASTSVTKATAECQVSMIRPTVDAHDPAVNAAIAKALATPTAEDLCEVAGPDDKVSVDGNSAVTANEHGLLSLSVTTNQHVSGRDLDGAIQSVFDLKTGRLLRPSDVLAPSGIEVVRKTCIDTLANEFLFDANEAQADCSLSLDESSTAGPAFF